ncbi:hypothetical protein VTK56DRAFT_8287 [Thermocarpiscus australiensis]
MSSHDHTEQTPAFGSQSQRQRQRQRAETRLFRIGRPLPELFRVQPTGWAGSRSNHFWHSGCKGNNEGGCASRNESRSGPIDLLRTFGPSRSRVNSVSTEAVGRDSGHSEANSAANSSASCFIGRTCKSKYLSFSRTEISVHYPRAAVRTTPFPSLP